MNNKRPATIRAIQGILAISFFLGAILSGTRVAAQPEIPIRGSIFDNKKNVNITFLSSSGIDYFLAITTGKSNLNSNGLAKPSLFLASCKGQKVNIKGVAAFSDNDKKYVEQLVTSFCNFRANKKSTSI